MFKHILFVTFFLLHMNTAYCEVYKWTDENGKTVYGDKPASDNADIVDIKKKPTQDKHYRDRVKKQKKLLGVMQEEREQLITKQKEEREKEEKREKECSDMKQKLQKMKRSTHLYEETDDPFNPKVYSNEERKAEEGKYENYIKENC
ncbi:MAG: DUF4124 domain-containing protein [Proteobacteria bacterium]|nr:DUF4124 domain-containing protein [Pseudomonadota bacterium]NOG59749.1 DUF4124 domain-containing protein [Pseudomonadota bacterium]